MDKKITEMTLKEYCEASRICDLEDFEIKILETYISAKIMAAEIDLHNQYRTIKTIEDNNRLILNNLRQETQLTADHSVLNTPTIT